MQHPPYGTESYMLRPRERAGQLRSTDARARAPAQLCRGFCLTQARTSKRQTASWTIWRNCFSTSARHLHSAISGAMENANDNHDVIVGVHLIDHDIRQARHHELIRTRCSADAPMYGNRSSCSMPSRMRSITKSAERGRSFSIHACIRSRSSYADSRMMTLTRADAQSAAGLLQA